MSLDFRFPFASTLANDQVVEAAAASGTEFGNLTATWKTIVWMNQSVLVAGGFGLAAPTAGDTSVLLANGRKILQIENEALHLLPYGAVLWTPTERAFFQAFLQFDIDANGNPVYGGLSGALPRLGTLQDASLMYLDFSGGYWCYQNPSAALVTAIAPVAELHYSTTLQDEETLSGNGIALQALTKRYDVLNITLGAHIAAGDRLIITPGVSLPLRDDDDQQFDYEAMVLANWYF
jgi:hypothetical protein